VTTSYLLSCSKQQEKYKRNSTLRACGRAGVRSATKKVRRDAARTQNAMEPAFCCRSGKTLKRRTSLTNKLINWLTD
jgi:hypothetical protein